MMATALKDYTLEDALKAYKDGFILVCEDGKVGLFTDNENYDIKVGLV